MNQNVGLLITTHYELGQFDRGRDLVRTALERYPFYEVIKFQSHRLLVSGGFVEEARQILDSMTGAGLGAYAIQMMRLRQACAEAALVTANQVFTDIGANWQTMLVMGLEQEAAEQLRPLDQEGTLYTLSAYMNHPYFDINQFPNLKAVLEREGVPLPVYQPVPYACPAPAL